MTPEQKQKIEQAAKVYAKSLEWLEAKRDFTAGAQHIIDHPSDFNFANYDTFSKEPVSALLVNALKYCTPEQLIALRNALNERTEDKLFSREEVVRLLSEYAPTWDLESARKWLDNHLKKATQTT